MFLYDKFFHDYDKTIAQILLNAEDNAERGEKGKPGQPLLTTLLEMHILPVVNENDSVSYTGN
jgi:glutamate 5-kinase